MTHERYYRLFYEPKLLKIFKEDRDVLVLDEQPKEPIFTFSQQFYKEILSKIPGELLLDKKLAKICEPIFEVINLMKTKTNNIESIKLIQKKDLKGNFELIKEFKEILTNKDNISELIENNLYIDNIMQFIKGIEIIYSSQCIYSDGRVSAYDKNYWFWTLKNNIILDANAFKLDKKYLCNTNFIRYDQSRIKDYSNSIFYYVNINTSKTKIYKYKNYYDKVINLIKDNIKTNDKILLITQKKEFQTINKKLEEYEILEQENYEISITWFGNIVGKNDWRNYNKIYIIASPNIPMELHVL